MNLIYSFINRVTIRVRTKLNQKRARVIIKSDIRNPRKVENIAKNSTQPKSKLIIRRPSQSRPEWDLHKNP